jgi:hypothetical protein
LKQEHAMPDIATPTLTEDQFETLARNVGGHDKLQRILAGAVEVHLVPAGGQAHAVPPSLTIPAGLDFEERIARGAYGWRHADLTEERYPVTPDEFGEAEPQLLHFNRNISSEEAVRGIRDAGLEPAGIGAILAFGEALPIAQRNHPVVGLGSIAEVDGKLSAPTLWFDGERRTLDLLWLDGDWHRNYRFLGTRRRHV